MSHETTSPRAARLAEIRRRIAAGTYDTPVRLAAALEAFLASPDARLPQRGELPVDRDDFQDFTAR